MNQEDKKLKDITVSDLKKAYLLYVLFAGIVISAFIIYMLVWAFTM